MDFVAMEAGEVARGKTWAEQEAEEEASSGAGAMDEEEEEDEEDEDGDGDGSAELEERDGFLGRYVRCEFDGWHWGSESAPLPAPTLLRRVCQRIREGRNADGAFGR